MRVIDKIISKSKWNIKCPYSMTPEYIVIHNTSNDASAQNEVSYMASNNLETSFHYAVDDIEAIQALPLNRNAWHASDGVKGPGNRKGIAIEICYSKSGGPKFEAAERNAAKLTAQLLKEYGWDISKVKRHQDFANKNCPHRTNELGWDRFLNMVKEEMGPEDLTTVNDIVWELSHLGIITNKELWLTKLNQDINAYWLARKCVNYIRSN